MEAAPETWLIECGRVGSVMVGAPVPTALIGGLEAGYQARRVADGVAQDAFRLDQPPLTILIADGPFAAADRQGHEPAADEHLRTLAVQAVRDGALVAAISVRGAGPATAAGVGVRSTLAQLRAAYAEVNLHGVPATEGDDEGVATTPDLPGLGFVFASPEAAERGAPVKRVDLWTTDG